MIYEIQGHSDLKKIFFVYHNFQISIEREHIHPIKDLDVTLNKLPDLLLRGCRRRWMKGKQEVLMRRKRIQWKERAGKAKNPCALLFKHPCLIKAAVPSCLPVLSEPCGKDTDEQSSSGRKKHLTLSIAAAVHQPERGQMCPEPTLGAGSERWGGPCCLQAWEHMGGTTIHEHRTGSHTCEQEVQYDRDG